MSDLLNTLISQAIARHPTTFDKNPHRCLEDKGLSEDVMPAWYPCLDYGSKKETAPTLAWLIADVELVVRHVAADPEVVAALVKALPARRPAPSAYDKKAWKEFASDFQTPPALLWALWRKWASITGRSNVPEPPPWPGAARPKSKAREKRFDDFECAVCSVFAWPHRFARNAVTTISRISKALHWLKRVRDRLKPGGKEGAREPASTNENDARKLRRIADAFRQWGREADLSGRELEKEHELARGPLLLAVKNLDVIMRARDRYGCAEGVAVTAGVFDKLQTAAAEHDQDTDLGKYWVWVRDLTEKHLPGNVSFPDELDRWANKLGQEANDSRQPAVAGGPDAVAGRVDKPSGFLGAMDLAKKFNVPKEKMDTLHKRLQRFREKHGDDPGYVISVEGPGPRDSRYLHSIEHVRSVIEDLARPA